MQAELSGGQGIVSARLLCAKRRRDAVWLGNLEGVDDHRDHRVIAGEHGQLDDGFAAKGFDGLGVTRVADHAIGVQFVAKIVNRVFLRRCQEGRRADGDRFDDGGVEAFLAGDAAWACHSNWAVQNRAVTRIASSLSGPGKTPSKRRYRPSS